MAGAFTESTVIGTASDTIDRLQLPEAEKTRLKNNIPVAYAVSYLVGTGFVVWFLSAAAPRLLRVDMKAESKKLAAQLSGAAGVPDHEVRLAYKEWSIRAYRMADAAAGHTVGDFEQAAKPERVFVERIRRGAGLLDAPPTEMPAGGRCAGHRCAAPRAARRKAADSRGARGPRAARLPDGDARRRSDETGSRGANPGRTWANSTGVASS